jgi:hypothetical protein
MHHRVERGDLVGELMIQTLRTFSFTRNHWSPKHAPVSGWEPRRVPYSFGPTGD